MKLVKFLMVCSMMTFLWNGLVSADEPPTVTAYQMERYEGVTEGDRVRFVGICTVETPRYGYSATVCCDPGGGEWAAIFVYDGQEQRLVAERGQICEAVGIVEEYYDKTELNCVDETEFPPFARDEWGSVPPPIETTTGEFRNSEALENCIIMCRNVQVMSEPDQYGSIAIDDGSGEATLLLRSIDPAPSIGFVYDCLIGHDDFHFGEFKIRPRDENDWTCGGSSTPTPTPTPTGGAGTPTPTPTGAACAPSLLLEFQSHTPGACFHGGDSFHATWTMQNLCDGERSVDLYLALQVFDSWFFAPSFGPELNHIAVTIRDGETIYENILPAFTWPSGVGSLNDGLFFWGVMLFPGTWDLTGEVEMLPFCYE
ncbi:hypothetical protein JXA80_09805 [bacterium]|nr:hypothetical protein [candidate division CSSED10-310 bacterium]